MELRTKDTQTFVDTGVKISIKPNEFEACMRFMKVDQTKANFWHLDENLYQSRVD